LGKRWRPLFWDGSSYFICSSGSYRKLRTGAVLL